MEKNKASEYNLFKNKFFKLKLPLYIVLFLCGIMLLYMYYKLQKDAMTADAQNDLKTIANMKVNQIEDWRSDRMRDAKALVTNKILSNEIIAIRDAKSSPVFMNELKNWFKEINSEYKNKSLKLIDSKGKVILADPPEKSYIDSCIKNNINDVIKSKKIFFTDFHRAETENIIHIDIMVPVISDKDPTLNKILVIERDPNVFLYPLVRYWPTESKTSETILVEDDGNGNTLFLNDLKNQNNTALKLIINKEYTDRLPVKAVNNISGIVEGNDYKGVPVLGFITPIKDTKWYMVAEIDEEEVYSNINKMTFQFMTLLGIILFIAVVTVYFQIRTYRQRTKHFKFLYELEAERNSLTENYEYVLKNANDAITITDMEGKFIDVNEKAVLLYNYTMEEFLSMNIKHLRIPEELKLVEKEFNEITSNNGLVFETHHIKKDGTAFPVEISSRLVRMKDKKYIQSIIRDISERKKSENALRNSEERYRGLFENMVEGYAYCRIIYENDEPVDWIYVDINDSFSKLTGLKDIKGKRVSEVIPGIKETDPEIFLIYSRVAMTGNPEIFDTYVDALKMWFSISVYSIETGYFVAVFDNITERKIAEKSLRTSEERLKLALSATVTGVCEIDIISDSIFWSPECFEIFGLKKKNLKFADFKNIIHPEDIDIFNSTMDNIFNNIKKTFSLEFRIISPVGGVIWISYQGETENDKLNNPAKIIGTIQDITDRKNAEERNRELTRLYAVLSQINSSIVWIKNKTFLLQECCRITVEHGNFNIAWVGMFDKLYQKIKPVAYAGNYENVFDACEMTNLCDCISLHDAINSIKNNNYYLSNDYDKDFEECEYKDKFKKLGYNSVAIFPIKIKGKVIGIFELISEKKYFFTDKELTLLNEVMTDISYALDNIETEKEKQFAINSLRISENKFKMIFEKASDAIIVMERDMMVDCNSMVTEISGYEKGELLNKSIIDFLPIRQKDGKFSKDIIKKMISNALRGNAITENLEVIKKDRSRFIIEVSLNSIQIDDKIMLIAIFRDVTEFLEYQESLKEAKEKAEEMSKLKSSFLANMSHELRTPMTGIIGFADVLSSSLENPEQKEMADVIYKSGRRLTDTLNLILDLSRIEDDKIEIKMKNVNLSGLAEESARLFDILAKEKNLKFETKIEENVFALLDEQLTEKILSNLIKNAIIYTVKGSVTVEAKKVIENGREFSVLKVTDTGIGIPKNQLNIIFEPFRQVSEGFSREFEGTGLGLTITKKYIEIMNGTISVSSTVNNGSEFTVKFPSTTEKKLNITRLKYEVEEKKSIEKIKDSTILIVEDDDNSRFSLEYTLKNLCTLEFTNNGEDAIKMVSLKKYDLIIMDMGLKGISGLDATKEIRKINGYQDIPILAVTAFAMIGDKEKAIEGGCTYYISKPFNFSELKKQVLELINKG